MERSVLVDTLLILLSYDAACGPRRMALFSDAKRCVLIILSPQRRVIKSGRAFCVFFLGYCWRVDGRWRECARGSTLRRYSSHFSAARAAQILIYLYNSSHAAETRPCKQCALRTQRFFVCGGSKASENYIIYRGCRIYNVKSGVFAIGSHKISDAWLCPIVNGAFDTITILFYFILRKFVEKRKEMNQVVVRDIFEKNLLFLIPKIMKYIGKYWRS
jgi:hypothetical protein